MAGKRLGKGREKAGKRPGAQRRVRLPGKGWEKAGKRQRSVRLPGKGREKAGKRPGAQVLGFWEISHEGGQMLA